MEHRIPGDPVKNHSRREELLTSKMNHKRGSYTSQELYPLGFSRF
jgi:hypothetical protein